MASEGRPAASVDRCECGAPADDIHFDRSICACGMAHYYCNQCGTQTEACVDESPAASAPSPAELHKQTGGGDAYRVAMLEHGYVEPTPPGEHRDRGKRALQCGLTHDFKWSPWRRYRIGGYEFEGRWCRTCATTQAREIDSDA